MLRRRIIEAWIVAALLFAGGSAWAHSPAPTGPAAPRGLAIPTLTHGEMAVIARSRAAILDLVSRQVPTDPVLRRLEGWVNLQFFACAWGVVPGSVTDDTSPFNECSHAYLAGTKALLLHLRDMPGQQGAVKGMVREIDAQMIATGASLVLCRFSDEPFDTSRVIGPRWADIPFDPPSLLVCAGLAAALAGVWLMIVPRAGRNPSKPARPSVDCRPGAAATDASR